MLVICRITDSLAAIARRTGLLVRLLFPGLKVSLSYIYDQMVVRREKIIAKPAIERVNQMVGGPEWSLSFLVNVR